MATSLNNVHEDLLFYNELKKHAFGKISSRIDNHNQYLIENGLIQIDALLEFAISEVSGVQRLTTVGADLMNGGDAKKVTSNWRNNDIDRGCWTNSYSVRNIHTKRGTLYVMGYNRFAKRFDYYAIPGYAYQHLNCSSIDIVLDRYSGYHNSIPKPTGDSAYCKWNIYKKDNFVDMACTESHNVKMKKIA